MPRPLRREVAGGLEDDPARHLDGVVGETLVEPAQQGHVDGGGHAVLPLPVHQHGEQVAVQVVHRVVFFADARGLLRVAGDSTSCALLPKSTATLPISAK